MVDGPRAPLFVPADRPDRIAKAAGTRADAVICDLEDAVAADAKAAARDGLVLPTDGPAMIVRINAAGTSWHAADVDKVRRLEPAAVMLPKCETATIVAEVVSALGGCPVIALIESGLGLANAREIARVPGIRCLAFGSIDYAADLNCSHLREILLPARHELVIASRAAGLSAPLDGVTTQIDDDAAVQSDAAHARSIGMGGKMTIHPKQTEHVLRAFAPDAAQISWARRVLQAPDGASRIDGEMVDAPVRARARAICAEADRLGL